eukprot:Gb_33559 [translate_table: standard]
MFGSPSSFNKLICISRDVMFDFLIEVTVPCSSHSRVSILKFRRSCRGATGAPLDVLEDNRGETTFKAKEDYVNEQLDVGYENYDEDPDEDLDEECDFECEDNGYDRDVEEDCEDKDEEDQAEEGFPELKSPPTSDNEDKLMRQKPKEHEDGEGDRIIHDPFPIVPQTRYSSYDDFSREDVDEYGDRNEDFEDSDKNPNKEEDPKHEVFGKEYYSDKNPDVYPNDEIGEQIEGKEDYFEDEDTKDEELDQEYEGHKEGDDSKYKEPDEEPDIGDDEGFSTDYKDETDRMFIQVEDNPAYEETSPKGRGNGLDQQTRELGGYRCYYQPMVWQKKNASRPRQTP